MNNRFQEENTQGFMDDYMLNLSLDEALGEITDPAVPESTPEEDERMRKMAAEVVTPFDTDVRPGEIRMLSQPNRLVFGVVLPWDLSCILFVPFSGMRHPATDLEMYAENGETKGEGMQVYQIWNARTIYKSVIRESWLCGTVSEAEMGRLNRMLRYHLLGEPLDESLRPLIGTPLAEEKDIRRTYIKEEIACFVPLDRANLLAAKESVSGKTSLAEDKENTYAHEIEGTAAFDSPIVPSDSSAAKTSDQSVFGRIGKFSRKVVEEIKTQAQLFEPLWHPEPALALAAGTEKTMEPILCSIENHEEILSIQFSPDKDAVWIEIDVFTADQEDFSSALDGAEIIDPDQNVLGTIHEHECVLKVGKGFDGRFALRTKDGTVYSIRKLA